MNNVQSERLANGLRVVLVEAPASHRVALSLLVGVGARFDPPERAGISHFVEHLLFRGNRAYPQSSALFAAFESNGGILGAQTDVELTEFDQLVQPDHLPEALRDLAHFVQEPTFPDLEKERQIVLDEILYDYNDQGELIRLDALVAELLWGTHPLATSVTGTRETVAAFTPERVAKHYRP